MAQSTNASQPRDELRSLAHARHQEMVRAAHDEYATAVQQLRVERQQRYADTLAVLEDAKTKPDIAGDKDAFGSLQRLHNEAKAPVDLSEPQAAFEAAMRAADQELNASLRALALAPAA